MPNLAKIVALAALFLAALPALGGVKDCLSEGEFRSLAGELAPRVNLFAEAWQQDVSAEFYGGTTRDYLYWLKGKFRECNSPEQGRKILGELRGQAVIDVREFIIGDSDVDVVSKNHVNLDPQRFGIKKFDTIKPDIFDPQSDRGKNEAVQGFIPAEKIRLQKGGLVSPKDFGDGLGEIYSGRLTVHFTDPKVFAQGHYAKQGINHPVLMALRYLRLQGINYYRSEGQGFPDLKKLMDIDPKSKAAVMAVLDGVTDGKQELLPFLEKEKFRSWLNGTIQKSFRSYTNPTAAHELLKAFGADKLPRIYNGVDPLNQYLFAKHRDPSVTEKNLKRLKVDTNEFYLAPEKIFSDGYLYHGTHTEEAFRGILLQGILPSTAGSADGGLYGVTLENKQFSEAWGGKKENLVRLPVNREAKIVDVTQGEGKRIWEKLGEPPFDTFAEDLGIDIIRYPYRTEAFVVKNSGVLGKPEGVYRKVMVISEAQKLAAKAHTAEDLKAFLESLELNNFRQEESRIILAALPSGWKTTILGGKLAGEKDFMDRIGTLMALSRVDEQTFREAVPEMRSVLKEYRDSGESLLQFVEKNGFDSPLLKARLSAEAFFSGVHPNEFLEFFKVLDSRPNAEEMWVDHFSRSWAKDSAPLITKMLNTNRAEATRTIDRLVKNGKFGALLANAELNEAYWRAWRDDPNFIVRAYFPDAQMIQKLGQEHPATFDRGMDIFLSADPKAWIERAPLGHRNNSDSRDTIRALYYAIMPRGNDSSFFRHPRANLWLKEFMDATLEGMETDTTTFSANMLKYSNVTKHPDATRWMNTLVAGKISKDIGDNRLISGPGELKGKPSIGMLDQEPWKSHPLRDIWLESMKLPRYQERTLKSMVIKRPRAAYVNAKRPLVLGLKKKIEAWQKSIPDTVVQLASDLPNAVLYKNTSCRTFFQKILVSDGW